MSFLLLCEKFRENTAELFNIFRIDFTDVADPEYISIRYLSGVDPMVLLISIKEMGRV